MKLCNETVSILKNFASINQSIQFREGNSLRTISPNKTILAEATIDEEIPSDFCIYDLNRFLGVLSLFNSPEIEVGENSAEIRSNGRKVEYTFASPTTFVRPPEKNLKLPEIYEEFELKGVVFREVMKALGVLSLPEIAIVGDGETLFIRCYDSSNPSSDHYSVELGETSKKFEAIFRTENLKIRDDDYNVLLSSKGLAHFCGDHIKYWIAIESNSNFS